MGPAHADRRSVGRARRLRPRAHALYMTRDERREVNVSMTATHAQVAELRERRREMRRELARVRWWRRLVQARLDLTVAHLSDFHELGSLGLDDAWEALVADAPTPEELTGEIWPDASGHTPTSAESLTRLDARLQSYEERVSDNLETVTAQMVRALGDVQRGGMLMQGGNDG